MLKVSSIIGSSTTVSVYHRTLLRPSTRGQKGLPEDVIANPFLAYIKANIWLSAFHSAPFKFLAEGKSFYVYSKLVSRHPDPLGALMNTRMAENKHDLAVLSEVSAKMFARFPKWIY